MFSVPITGISTDQLDDPFRIEFNQDINQSADLLQTLEVKFNQDIRYLRGLSIKSEVD